MNHKYVYLFTEGNGSMRELLGGKGANLAEMTNIGLPVPQGFTFSGVAGRSGAAGVRKNLSALMENLAMKLIGGMGTDISLDEDAFQTNRLNLSKESEKTLKDQAELFLSQLP